ncbi:MAG: hypothetical protein AAB604_00350 [Patescibacteria group bacterium]
MKNLFFVLAILFTFVFGAWGAMRVVKVIQFDRNCEGYLKRAADANTVELAAKNLAVAVKYLKSNKLTSGYTSFLWRTPDEDVGFWYENITSALKELLAVRPDASQLERTNVLMKLRETLLDEGRSVSVTVPAGMSIFPANASYAIVGFFLSFFAGVLWLTALIADDY